MKPDLSPTNPQSVASAKPAPFVYLEHYSGPLDLLLDLIRKQEMDIFQVDLSKITSQYLESMKKIQDLDLETAGDFVRMAGLLIYIKSRSLIPPKRDGGKRVEEEDPSQLKEKFLELLSTFQKFQAAGELLYNRNLLGRDCWSSHSGLASAKSLFKSSPLEVHPSQLKMEIDKEQGVSVLVRSYSTVFENKRAKETYKIKKPIPAVFYRLRRIAGAFKAGLRLSFAYLSRIQREKYSRLLSFLSLLELSKAGFVSLLQKGLFSNIDVFVKKEVSVQNLREISSEERQTGS